MPDWSPICPVEIFYKGGFVLVRMPTMSVQKQNIGLKLANHDDLAIWSSNNEQHTGIIVLEDALSIALPKLMEAVHDGTFSCSEAVITVPVDASVAVRLAIYAATHKAGLRVLQVIDEPTAVALAYGMDTLAEERRWRQRPNAQGREQRHVLIFDLGASSCDVTLLSIKKGMIKVPCTYCGSKYQLSYNWIPCSQNFVMS